MPKLYLGNINHSSWSIRGVLVTRASGLDIEEIVMPLGPPETKDRLLAETGQHRVPVLIADDLVIFDSLAITEWVAEQVEPGMVWPVDPVKRARARSVCAEMHASFINLRSFMGVDIRGRHPTPEMTAGLKWDIDRVTQIWTEARAQNGTGGDFMFGEWSAADAFYMPVVTRFRTYGVALDGVAKAYSDAVLAHPLVKQIEAEAEAEPWRVDLDRVRPVSAD